MFLTHWLSFLKNRHLGFRKGRKQIRRPGWHKPVDVSPAAELLEDRTLLATMATFDASGRLAVTLDSGGVELEISKGTTNVQVTANSSAVTIKNFLDNTMTVTPALSAVKSIIVNGGSGADEIHLANVTTGDFSGLSNGMLTVNGGAETTRLRAASSPTRFREAQATIRSMADWATTASKAALATTR